MIETRKCDFHLTSGAILTVESLPTSWSLGGSNELRGWFETLNGMTINMEHVIAIVPHVQAPDPGPVPPEKPFVVVPDGQGVEVIIDRDNDVWVKQSDYLYSTSTGSLRDWDAREIEASFGPVRQVTIPVSPIAPVGQEGLIDSDGDLWLRQGDGIYAAKNGSLVSIESKVVERYGPVRRVRVIDLDEQDGD